MIEKLLISAGAMKAGTSWLFKQLSTHEQIETVPIKEIHYFAHVHTDISFLDEPGRIDKFKTYARDCDAIRSIADIAADAGFFRRYLNGPVNDRWYERLFVGRPGVFRADFSNMACILNEGALRHMRECADELRVIYTLRDPLERLWSHVKYHAMVMGDLGRIEGFSTEDFRAYCDQSGAAAQSDYAANIGRMRAHLSDDELKVFYLEDFEQAPQSTLNELFSFIGVSRQRRDDDRLRVRHNEGPGGAMSPAFLRCAAELLLPQEDALAAIGVAPHHAWSYAERLRAAVETEHSSDVPELVGELG